MRRAALWLEERLKARGFRTELHETPLHPILYAERFVDEKAPTVLVYGHYDVQPPDPLELWESPPFSPVVREGRIYARGASDDKGQLFAHVLAAEEAPVNLKFLVEGEEEIGSPHLPLRAGEPGEAPGGRGARLRRGHVRPPHPDPHLRPPGALLPGGAA